MENYLSTSFDLASIFIFSNLKFPGKDIVSICLFLSGYTYGSLRLRFLAKHWLANPRVHIIHIHIYVSITMWSCLTYNNQIYMMTMMMTKKRREKRIEMNRTDLPERGHNWHKRSKERTCGSDPCKPWWTPPGTSG